MVLCEVASWAGESCAVALEISLNDCPVMKCHKSITITENTVKIAQRFASADELCKGHFGKLGQRWVLSLAL